jgi:SAM-dependent methyltransferase
VGSTEPGPDPSLQAVPDRHGVMARNEQAWEDWGKVDPLWAVVTASDKQHGQWDVDEFFRSGQESIDSLLEEGAGFGVPTHHGRALDFGCGVGRLTRALGTHVDQVLGLDVSGSMIERAIALNSGRSGIEFAVHRDGDLHAIDDDAMDVVCSLLVLQHIPSIGLIENYLREFVRVLAPGGLLVINLPVRVRPPDLSLRARLRPRTRFYDLLRRCGVSPAYLYEHFRWSPDMPMNALPIERVESLLVAADGKVLESRLLEDEGGVQQALYFATC